MDGSAVSKNSLHHSSLMLGVVVPSAFVNPNSDGSGNCERMSRSLRVPERLVETSRSRRISVQIFVYKTPTPEGSSSAVEPGRNSAIKALRWPSENAINAGRHLITV